MKRTFITLCACLGFSACVTKNDVKGPVELGYSERTMVAKMMNRGARDVTSQTRAEFYASIALEQRYYWWELPDQTIVAVLVAGPGKREKTVTVIEIGEPGRGVEGIKTWRSQNLREQSLLPDKRKLLK